MDTEAVAISSRTSWYHSSWLMFRLEQMSGLITSVVMVMKKNSHTEFANVKFDNWQKL